MMDELMRRLKEHLFAPLARRVGRSVSPLLVTVVAFLFGVAAAVFGARGAYAAGLLCWAANRVLDGFDGTLARVQDRQTDFGGYLDILLDFVVYAIVPLGLALAAPTLPTLVATAALLGSFFVNAASWMYLSAILERRSAGAKARAELTTVTMPPGLVAGTETVILFTLFFLLPGQLAPLYWLMTTLVGLTIVQRLVWGARHL